MVAFTVKPAGQTDQEIPARVRLVGHVRVGDGPGPLIGFAPSEKLNGGGLPYVSRRVAVVWGWQFPTCVLPRRGAKPLGDSELDRQRLGDDPIALTKVSKRRLEASAGDVNFAVERDGWLSVHIVDNTGEPVLVEKTTKAIIDGSRSPDEISLAIGLWAADQTRAVWPIGRHLLNGI